MTIEELQVVIRANTSHFQTELNGVRTQLDQVRRSVGGVSSGISTLTKGLKYFIGMKAAQYIFKLGKACLTMAMDVQESENLFSVSMGAMAASARTWSSELSQALGLNEYEVRKNVGVLYNMTTSMGLLQNEAYQLSTTLTELIYDMSSFYNISTDEAFTKVSAGLTGETEPLKRLGILVNENTIKQVAYRNGIATTGSVLTEQQKVMARYIAIMEQTSNAQGDLARTIDSPANQLRRLQTILQVIKINLGNAFMPIAKIVLPLLNSLASSIARITATFATFMQALFGVKTTIQDTAKSAASIGGAYESIGNEAEKAGKKAKGSLAGFDEINNIKQDSGAGVNGGGVGDSLGSDVAFEQTEGAMDKIPAKIQAIADKVKAIFASIFKPFKDSWDKYGDSVMKAFNKAWEATKSTLSNVGRVLGSIWDNGGSKLVENISNLVLSLSILAMRIYEDFILPIVDWFVNIFDPETNGAVQSVLDGINWLLEKVTEFITYLSGDGFPVLEFLLVVVGSIALAVGIVNLAMGTWGLIMGVVTGVSYLLSIATTAIGLAFLFLTSPIGIAIAAIAAVIAIGYYLIKNWDEISVWLQDLWENIKTKALEVWEGIKTFFSETWDKIKTKCNEIWESIKTYLFEMWDSIKNKCSGVWTSVKEFFVTTWNNIKTTASNIWNNILTTCKTIFNNLKNYINEIWEGVKGIFNGIVEFVSGVFTGNWERAWEGVKKVFKSIFDTFGAIAKTPLNAIIKMINTVIGGFNKLSFSIPDWVPEYGGRKFGVNIPNIPQLARGGIVDSSTIFMAGEAGKEVVMPLENNTGWMNTVAQGILRGMGDVSQQNNSDDRPLEVVLQIADTQLGRVVINSINKVQRQSGRILLDV